MASVTGGPFGSDPDGEYFRPDLEGLRAIAVLLVLLYHARVPGFAGGFVGVDVFFVLSGFLITGLLIRELRSTGTVSLRAFYARRARRLLPAAALVLTVTLIGSVVLLSPLRIPAIAADIGSAAAYVSNIRFAIEANDYFAAGASHRRCFTTGL
jgi:peptidoglycan/LPS O-acetylase OafA/YrhL